MLHAPTHMAHTGHNQAYEGSLFGSMPKVFIVMGNYKSHRSGIAENMPSKVNLWSEI